MCPFYHTFDNFFHISYNKLICITINQSKRIQAMKKLAIFLCSLLLLSILMWQGTNYIIQKRELETVYSAKDLGSDYVAVTISAAGDCTLGTDTNSLGSGSFENEVNAVSSNYSHFLKNVASIFEQDDLTIVNFEGTLSLNGTRADKEFAFRGHPDYVKVITSSSVEAVNLANNHTRDYGEIALSDTKDIMTENGVVWFEGKNYAITEIDGIKIGLLGTNNQNPEHTANFLKTLEKVKKENPDLIIASFHWGVERSLIPEEYQINLAHSAIDNGVDLVLGHHPHVLQGIEKYKGKYIVYSLGNFCFGGNKNPADKDTMIFRQTFLFEGNTLIPKENVSVIPCSISSEKGRNNYQPTPLSGNEFNRVKEKLIKISSGFSGIEDINFIEKKIVITK